MSMLRTRPARRLPAAGASELWLKRRIDAVRAHGPRLTTFGLIGAAVFALGMGLQWVLIRLGASADGSYAGQCIFSIELSFCLNRLLTWRTRELRLLRAAAKWNAQKLAFTVPNFLGYALLVGRGFGWLLANLSITAAFTVLNYVLADTWSFRGISPAGHEGEPIARTLVATGCSWRPTVSVVIPCRDNARTIRSTIEGILAQDYPALDEIILVGSADDSTWPALAGLDDHRLVLIEHQRVAGRRDAAAKRDLGIRLAAGSLIALVDSDIVLSTRWLSSAVALLDGQGRHGLVCGGMRSIDDGFWGRFVDRNVIAAKTPRVEESYSVTAHNFGKRGRKPPIAANLLFSREIYDRCPYDPSWTFGYEDYEWAWRIARSGYPILFAAGLEGAHHHRQSFLDLCREYLRAADGCARFVHAHPDSPLARKRRRQAVTLPVAGLSTMLASTLAVADGHAIVPGAIAIAAMVGLAVREIVRSRTLAAVSYPLLGLVLAAIFTAAMARRLALPDRLSRASAGAGGEHARLPRLALGSEHAVLGATPSPSKPPSLSS